MTKQYFLKDIENIIATSVKYTLPNDILDIIKKLELELNCSNTPNFDKPDSRKNYNTHTHTHTNIPIILPSFSSQTNIKHNINNEWERNKIDNTSVESTIKFKATKIVLKEGVDKYINDIRINLNKLTDKNYDVQKNIIIEKIDIIKNHKYENENDNDNENKVDTLNPNQEQKTLNDDMNKVTKVIFDIASSNKFFSELYAKLYKELIQHFDIFQTIINEHIDTFKYSINNILYIDPNTDYDGYCKYTKTNDQRKAHCMFIVNLIKNNVLDIDVIYDILQYFLTKSLEFIHMENKNIEVEEITENIFIIVTNIYSFIQLYINNNPDENNQWKTNILPNIIKISQMKLKEYPSISNRAIFKYMDIIDTIE